MRGFLLSLSYRRCAWVRYAVLAVLLTFVMTGCTSQSFSGASILQADYQKISPGSTQDDVLGIVGPPSFTGQRTDENWYYVTTEWSRRLFFPRRVVNRRLLHLEFDNEKQLIAKNEQDISDIKAVKPDLRITPTLGVRTTLVQEIFGNIGAVH